MFVIRSMSTTDYRPGQKVEPYHVYLLSREKRAGAWWSRSRYDRATFATAEDAYAELERLGLCGRCSCAEVVPADDREVPTFWDRSTAERQADAVRNGVAIRQDR